jgi:hypothetical protein
MMSAPAHTHAEDTNGVAGNLSLPLLFWGFFALLLGLTISRHEMWSDEMQAFLIARDSNSLAALFHNLRYEGHPALWHLLLMIPAHISWNPAGMQILNYLLALIEAWLILSARALKLPIRVLLIFSFTLFYTDATLSRSYMLAILLLTAAVAAYNSNRSINTLSILFLALAINTHLFAIPTAFFLAVWLFFPDIPKAITGFPGVLRSRERIFLSLALLGSTVIALLTMRPPADEFLPHYGRISYSLAHNLLVSFSGLWAGIFIPYPLVHATFLAQLLPDKDHAPLLAIFLTLLCLLLATLTLRTSRARVFFLLASASELLLFALTVHLPELRHYGMIFAAFLLALLIDARSSSSASARIQLKPVILFTLLIAYLSLQATYGLYAALQDWRRPYSYAHAASNWLRQNQLDQSPLLIVGASGPSIVGYLERPSVHYAACDCDASYYKYASNWDYEKPIHPGEILSLGNKANLPVVIVSNRKFADSELATLKIHKLIEFSGDAISGSERYFIYQQNAP